MNQDDFGRLPDDMDLLDDRQDLSQYSYDPNDLLETISTFPSQQSSQASEKADVFLGVPDDTDGEDVLEFLSKHQHHEMTTIDVSAVAEQLPKQTASIPPPVAYVNLNEVNAVTSQAIATSTSYVTAYKTLPVVVQAESDTIDSDLWSETSRSTCIAYSPRSATGSSTEISDSELIKLPTRELNRRLQSLSPDERRVLKQRRRTLKNRGYAQICRSRRVGHHHQLETTNQGLQREVQQLKRQVDTLTKERDQLRLTANKYKADCDQYRQLVNMLTNGKGLCTVDDYLRDPLAE